MDCMPDNIMTLTMKLIFSVHFCFLYYVVCIQIVRIAKIQWLWPEDKCMLVAYLLMCVMKIFRYSLKVAGSVLLEDRWKMWT